MRQKLGLFANIRPTFTFPSLVHHSPLKKERIDGTNLVFLRELTGGIYFGKKGRKDPLFSSTTTTWTTQRRDVRDDTTSEKCALTNCCYYYFQP